jgi:hypothetical protein
VQPTRPFVGSNVRLMPARFSATRSHPAADQTDPLAVLVMLMRMVIRSDADPYLLNGALIEGVATTIMQRIPEERREAVSHQVMRVLHDRLRDKGAI